MIWDVILIIGQSPDMGEYQIKMFCEIGITLVSWSTLHFWVSCVGPLLDI